MKEGGEYEEVPLEGGGFKRRWVGAKQWKHHCEHGKQKARCKECGGSSICEHGRHRKRCKECGESSVCEHGRQRHRCMECKPPPITQSGVEDGGPDERGRRGGGRCATTTEDRRHRWRRW